MGVGIFDPIVLTPADLLVAMVVTALLTLLYDHTAKL